MTNAGVPGTAERGHGRVHGLPGGRVREHEGPGSGRAPSFHAPRDCNSRSRDCRDQGLHFLFFFFFFFFALEPSTLGRPRPVRQPGMIGRFRAVD